MVVKSFAKLNLALRITRRRPDGYHDLSTIFQEIDFCDELSFQPAPAYSLEVSDPALPRGSDNLCSRAYNFLWNLCKPTSSFKIYLKKNIPTGAGLGGGSSNAAAVLKFLNQAWELNLRTADLEQIAAQIGSDVPFYIRGGTQGATGRGEILTPLELPEKFVVLLVLPSIAISTVWAYQQFDLNNCRKEYKFNSLFDSNRVKWELFENQFETVVFPAYPEIGAIKQQLLAAGAKYAGLSGSGSTVFGIFNNRVEAEAARLRFTLYRTHIAFPITSREKQR